jgi:putative flavoprotein involved in K+ transport
MATIESFDTVIVGGGQAGLAAAYYLSRQAGNFIVLDAAAQVGAAWQQRWDSLRLFTPARFDGLPGMPFPGADFYFPTKDEVAAYLQAYARQFNLPVRLNSRVSALIPQDGGYRLIAGDQSFQARQVIVASGAYQQPALPDFAQQLDPQIVQLHSSAYRNPRQLPTGDILVVGAANSGAEIAIELAQAGRQVWLSGRDVGRIPADPLGRWLGGYPYWWFISRVLSVSTPLGRKVRLQALRHGTPLIGVRPAQVLAAGVQRVLRTTSVSQGQLCLADGRRLPVNAVVWATGYRPDYSWIQLPIFEPSGYPRHARGVVPQAPGLYFLGLPFQTALSSPLLGGVGADARYITGQMRGVAPASRAANRPVEAVAGEAAPH